MPHPLLCMLFLLSAQAALSQTTMNDQKSTPLTESQSNVLSIYHKKDGAFIKRGIITGLPGVPQYEPTEHEIVKFDQRDPFYQIKLKDERTGHVILQSAKMCQMVASEWKDHFIINLDENNNFYHYSYYPATSDCPTDISYPVVTNAFNTSVTVMSPEYGPKPLLGHFAAEQPKQKSKKSTAKINDGIVNENEIVEEKSFFQKYWYLILGAVLLMLTNNMAPEPASASGSGTPRRR
ncbi:hypothetical protein BDF20DRAFT_864306 [Mycotypha africana]|uniref:uncharacterized protein n=1 Tax=Mycotypha africana TaxID=64632 RepID=UPI002301C3E5|nr:uncharacterized protein BDF20DRAFT_864306 [Mycotypha africana]KAI8981958.1 hypothetical protein BDF20DRAFT_864306 [Mycotypha africana]